MGRLSEEEKKEWLAAAHSPKLKKDFENMKKNARRLNSKKKYTADDFLRFLMFFDKFANHPKKPFKKMKGNDFIL
ncbi:MAG: hypothetical protein ABH836_08100 [Candidatus Omnitrophota bacterium]